MRAVSSITNNGNEIKKDQDFKIKEQGKKLTIAVRIKNEEKNLEKSIKKVEDFFKKCVVAIDYRDMRRGSMVICQEMEVGRLAEFAQLNEGYINVNLNGHNEKKYIELNFNIDLSPDGNVDINGEQYLRMKIKNLSGLGVIQIDIFIEKIEVLSKQIINYKRHSMSTGESIERIPEGNSSFLITPTKGYDHIDLTYPEGISEEITKVQAERLMYDMNDIVAVFAGTLPINTENPNIGGVAIYGYWKYYIIPLQEAKNITLQTNGEGIEYTLIQYRSIDEELNTSSNKK